MAAREGVGAARQRRLHIFESPATDGRFCSLVRGISREINRKRVTSVEVNSNQTLVKTHEASWGYMVKPHGSLVSVS